MAHAPPAPARSRHAGVANAFYQVKWQWRMKPRREARATVSFWATRRDVWPLSSPTPRRHARIMAIAREPSPVGGERKSHSRSVRDISPAEPRPAGAARRAPRPLLLSDTSIATRDQDSRGRRSAWFPVVGIALALLVTGCANSRSHAAAPTSTTSSIAPSTTTTRPPPTTTTTAPAPNLSLGDSGPAVLALQQRLSSLGYWLGTPSGTFGDSTEQAVYAIQKAAGITATA